ncbi:uncharacterized protein H6S33_009365 [Morchella sextelata]|uniref:uncharacterized protein n=1 Tax=Morchella sextelata TaxID=1174677 RepID=UPI001D0489D2|nr:uncharacterized protein H6S33_009365 [Morchella sextelata]KAH0612985.1 hypothetical protein H6S33_009365 [Morchella sextelata]
MRGSEFENRVRHAAKPKSPTESPAPRLSNGPDADALRAALSDAVASPVPAPSPSRKRQRIVYGDRFIPNREGVDLQASYSLLHADGSPSTPSKPKKRTPHGELHFQKTEEANRTFSTLLRSELFHNEIPQGSPSSLTTRNSARDSARAPTPPATNSSTNTPATPSKNLFTYMSPKTRTPQTRHGPNVDTRSEIYSLSPVRFDSQRMLLSPRKQPRAGSHVAIGTNKGYVQIWDAKECRRLRVMTGHTARVGALAWNDHILTSGSRDRTIYHRDVRAPDQHIAKLVGHKQEVCGLKWNCEDGQLASGGNDNKLFVWDKLSEQPLYKFTEHTAAVKAIAWSPHQHGTLASGGGTADRRIKFWNTLTGQPISEIDTGSQVCNLAWSKNSNEIVSTHGYSENQIVVWKYPSMTQVVSLTGHTYRVLYLAMSPDGQVIVTGAGDETLRFWNCFAKNKNEGRMSIALDPFQQIR